MLRKDLAKKAEYEALRVRARAGIPLNAPANPIDIAEKLGVQVWFRRIASLEGMLIRAPHPVILLSTSRPAGRILFTCAHELGHFWLGHGGHVDAASDESILREDTDDERQANIFASSFLMPKTTVQHALAQRSFDPNTATPTEILRVSHWLGVSYSTLIRRLRYDFRLITDLQMNSLIRQRPGDIARKATGSHTPNKRAVHFVDSSWTSRPLDMEAGDIAVLDEPVSAYGQAVELQKLEGKTFARAKQPGEAVIDNNRGWTLSIRVRRYKFEGRSIFRHLEDDNGP